jgi:multisubunit Na+/H+ antiporter MnhB subunit
METTIQIYDLLLVLTLIGAAWKALFGREAFASTVVFVSFGFLIALVWVQLGAADVGLAEAGVGAGLTGALMLGTIQHFEKGKITKPRVLAWPHVVPGALAIALTLALGMAIWNLRFPGPSVQPLVEAHMAESGSSHPVTSVLLNFRAFDTWLELGVLLLASLSAIIVDRINRDRLPFPPTYPRNWSIGVLARTMMPLLIVIGGIMLWFGARSPGGAFQAGALIGAAGIFLQLAGQSYFPVASSLAFRMTLALGFSTFMAASLVTYGAGGRILEYPQPWPGTFILVLEMAATLSIALTLNLLYAITSRVGGTEP